MGLFGEGSDFSLDLKITNSYEDHSMYYELLGPISHLGIVPQARILPIIS